MTASTTIEDELTIARIELDAAWEAAQQARTELERVKIELQSHKRMTARNRPLIDAFQRISSVAYGWQGAKRVNSKEAMERVAEELTRGRERHDKVVRIQEERP